MGNRPVTLFLIAAIVLTVLWLRRLGGRSAAGGYPPIGGGKPSTDRDSTTVTGPLPPARVPSIPAMTSPFGFAFTPQAERSWQDYLRREGAATQRRMDEFRARGYRR